MEEEDRPIWVRDLISQVQNISKHQNADSFKLNNISLYNSLLEAKLGETLLELITSKILMEKLANKVKSTSNEKTIRLRKLLQKNYLNLFGIPESKDKTTGELMDKLTRILSIMDLDLANLYMDNIHRILSNSTGPKPVIVRFTSYLDRQLVWEMATFWWTAT